MKATGIVRRIDDLGRIVIPKEIRRTMRVNEGSPMEIYMTEEGILLKKYYPHAGLSDLISAAAEELEELSADLGPERTGNIRRHIKDIQKVLKEDL